MGDDECVNSPRFGKPEELYQTLSFHVEAGTNISEDQRTCLEAIRAFSCQCLELSVKVTIIFLSMTGDSCIDSTTLLCWSLDEITMHESKESIDLRERNSTVSSNSPKTLELTSLVPSMDGPDAHSQSERSL